MEPEQLLAAGMIVQLLGLLYVRRRRRRLDREQDQQAQRARRRVWVHEMNQTRRESSVFNRFNQLKQFPDRFHSNFRMSPQTFTYLLQLIAHRITKQDTQMRLAIPPDTRLCVTLHFLVTGMSFGTLAYIYALGRKTVSDIIYDTCEAIWDILQPIYLRLPSTHNEWQGIADKFYDTWNFPNCLGAIDGKHIYIRAPDNTGTVYFNYKKTFSINLMAVASADYRFISVDIGQIGSASDSGIWDRSEFGTAWKNKTVNTPPPRPLPGTQDPAEYVMIGDEAFPLQSNLLRPFPGRDLDTIEKKRYNYRLSRARRVVENTFGILTNRFRVLFTTIDADAAKATSLVRTCCVLHNMLCSVRDNIYMPAGFGDNAMPGGVVAGGFWRAENQNLDGLAAVARGHSVAARNARNRYANWFSAEGAVDWQDAHVNRVR